MRLSSGHSVERARGRKGRALVSSDGGGRRLQKSECRLWKVINVSMAFARSTAPPCAPVEFTIQNDDKEWLIFEG
jgi:hypothetical protein